MVRRREFIAGLGGAAAAPAVWSLAARAQQPALPVVAVANSGSADSISLPLRAAFFKGLSETGYVEGQNVTIEYHGLEGQFDQLRAMMDDLVRRHVAVIVAAGNSRAIAAKAATKTIPIVFGVGDDPVKLGLVASLAHPGGNATGFNDFTQEVLGKRLVILHDLVPKAVRVAVLVNPANVTITETVLREVQEAARVVGLQIRVLNASTSNEIDAAFATFERERPEALFVAPDAFFLGRIVQFVTLAAHHRIPAAYGQRNYVEAGGLMSYGTDSAESFHQVGVYTGSILKGAKPADLPVVQAVRFEFVINLRTARSLGIDVPPQLLAITNEVIE